MTITSNNVHFILVAAISLFSFHLQAELYIEFQQAAYAVGEEIEVEIFSDEDFLINNDITQVCQKGHQGINRLGASSQTGVYFMQFKTTSQTYDYILWVGATKSASAIQDASPIRAQLSEMGALDPFEAFVNQHGSTVWATIAKEAFIQLGQEKTVGISTTILVCTAAGFTVQPNLIMSCGSGSLDIAVSFTDIYVTILFQKMHAVGLISQQQLDDYLQLKDGLVSTIAVISVGNIANTAKQIELGLTVLERISVHTNQQDLAILMGQQKDLFVKTVLILKMSK